MYRGIFSVQWREGLGVGVSCPQVSHIWLLPLMRAPLLLVQSVLGCVATGGSLHSATLLKGEHLAIIMKNKKNKKNLLAKSCKEMCQYVKLIENKLIIHALLM